jgi:hypothetical protein
MISKTIRNMEWRRNADENENKRNYIKVTQNYDFRFTATRRAT